ncbi:MAG: nickel pincer cofactor biosynthesis protein LarC [Actinomycetota bacterium]
MKSLYIDCINGAAGDMLLGALLDAGASEQVVRAALDALDLPGWSLSVETTARRGIRAMRVQVTTDDDAPARRYTDIVAILQRANLEPRVTEPALRAFELLGRAEAHVHDTDLAELHLHEVGAVDAIIDVVGVCAAVADLGVERVLCSPVPTGRGTIEAAHGVIPLPAPAVTEILKGAPLFERGTDELITPTGAALLATLADGFGAMPEMVLGATGYGAGTRDTKLPNVVRVLVGSLQDRSRDSHLLLEWNLDDMTPEIVPYAIERIIAAGALDAWATPVTMKKGRPGVQMSALAAPGDLDEVLGTIYEETTTLGVRIRGVARDELEREWTSVEIEGHPVRLKLGRRAGRVVNIAPEYEDAAKVARITGLPLKEIYRRATSGYDEGD